MIPPDYAQATPPWGAPPVSRRPERAPARRRRSLRPFLLGLLLLVIVGGVIAILATDQLGGQRPLPEVDAQDPQEAIQQARDLIRDNTAR